MRELSVDKLGDLRRKSGEHFSEGSIVRDILENPEDIA
ncbi:hypothetical protein K239x_59520 [Planctomycetes bacterium K23_9]|uniref:Uncharacterized protein n=1 Tax=Stieleria marina TaxID=1930275 RepID=A0A517P3I9_9BACT|nr:hypothetical protein K239x_59520 [Planctomycetes bacterium K23_9]